VFDLLWVIGWSVFVLPLAVAALRGWAPRWVRRRVSPWGVRVRAVALLVFWAGRMVVPLARWGGLNAEDSAFLMFPAQFGLMMSGVGLMCGSELGERLHRQAMRSWYTDEARGGEERPDRPWSTGRLSPSAASTGCRSAPIPRPTAPCGVAPAPNAPPGLRPTPGHPCPPPRARRPKPRATGSPPRSGARP